MSLEKNGKVFKDAEEFIEHIIAAIEEEKRTKPIRYYSSVLWLKLDLKGRYYRLKYGVKNLIKWLPTIWRDRDWDEGYLLLLMSKKMENMSKLQTKYGSSVNAELYAEQLMRCSTLSKRLADNDYDYEDWTEEMAAIEKDTAELFDTMKKHIYTWWD